MCTMYMCYYRTIALGWIIYSRILYVEGFNKNAQSQVNFKILKTKYHIYKGMESWIVAN